MKRGYKIMEKLKDQIKFSMGNKKIGNDTMIINISSAKDCEAGKMGFCPLFENGKCYAMKAERLYPQVLPYRIEQKRIFDKLSAYEIANQIIAINDRKRNKIKYLRFNESGDFKGQNDVWKVNIIAEMLKEHNIKVYTYTHRKDLDFSNLCDNLTINSSWKDKKIHNRFLSYKTNIIDRIMKIKKNKKIIRCIGDCSKCHACKSENDLIILCDIH
jgi:hypothetical protein